jgi:hypothetical protein|tara:strand:+ start:981 stop:1187 length:207 start_codon:yes stop_codon:yes gene_type:complete
MPRTRRSPPKFKVGDLVYLAYDTFGMYGKGIILAKHSHGDWEVYWFGERGHFIEHPTDIRLVELPDDD